MEQKIYKAIAACMKAIRPISKDRPGEGNKYKFRGVDDVMNEIQPILAENGVFPTVKIISMEIGSRVAKSGGEQQVITMQGSVTLWAEDGSSVTTEAAGCGMDSGDKAVYKAMSGVWKYAMLELFAIPTDDPKDAEDDRPDTGKKGEGQKDHGGKVLTDEALTALKAEWEKVKAEFLTLREQVLPKVSQEEKTALLNFIPEKATTAILREAMARLKEKFGHFLSPETGKTPSDNQDIPGIAGPAEDTGFPPTNGNLTFHPEE